MHIILLFAAYLAATTLGTPVAQIFDTFEGDIALLNGQGIINNPPQDFSEPGYVDSTGQEQEGGYDTTTATNYLQAQVPSQDVFSGSGAGCSAEKLFCCQGGSGPPGTLMSDSEFQEKCVLCMSSLYFLIIHSSNLVAASFAKSWFGREWENIDSEQKEQDDKCQVESNGSCCQSKFAAGAVSFPFPLFPQRPTTTPNKPSLRPSHGESNPRVS